MEKTKKKKGKNHWTTRVKESKQNGAVGELLVLAAALGRRGRPARDGFSMPAGCRTPRHLLREQTLMRF
ncbi:hypothetical protein HZH66_012244 [Vespula vulgaris]|uniref:Uncharacterized protein n=1 Tax=Vespula vulgaris TaxID=7454 RepID=A0A834MW31_VESVU|nr:hypothetical protein HZH66_012244 [Vespula vulgaris]